MLPTPDLSHLTRKDYEHIYEPAEDTFILLDALEKDVEELRSLQPRICLEIGSGSGCVSTFVAKLLGPSECLYLCTDVNRHAAYCTLRTGRQNNVTLDPVLSDLTDAFYYRLRLRTSQDNRGDGDNGGGGGVDLLIFNPPYVPTIPEEASSAQEERDIAGAWAGGPHGMAVVNKVLDKLKTILSPKGRFYLVAVKQNDVPAIQLKMKNEQGLESKVVLERRAGVEYLYVLKFFWPE